MYSSWDISTVWIKLEKEWGCGLGRFLPDWMLPLGASLYNNNWCYQPLLKKDFSNYYYIRGRGINENIIDKIELTKLRFYDIVLSLTFKMLINIVLFPCKHIIVPLYQTNCIHDDRRIVSIWNVSSRVIGFKTFSVFFSVRTLATHLPQCYAPFICQSL